MVVAFGDHKRGWNVRCSLIFNARGAQIGYIEGDRAFDLTGRERCNYARATGNLSDLNGEKIVGHISLDGTFVGLSWISDELFGKPSGEVHPDRTFARKQRRHLLPKKANVRRLDKSSVKEPKDVPPQAATAPQPENLVEHSPPVSKSSADAEPGSNASEEVADEVPVPHQEPIVGARNATKSSSTQDELVGRCPCGFGEAATLKARKAESAPASKSVPPVCPRPIF